MSDITIGAGQLTDITCNTRHALKFEGHDDVSIILRVQRIRVFNADGSESCKSVAAGFYVEGKERGLSSRQIRGAVDYACRVLNAEPCETLKRILEL
jgi:hypothetical protein